MTGYADLRARLAPLVQELRAEAIKDGDPETCLGWEAANAIDELLARTEEQQP